jgi:chromate reductase
MTPPIRLLGISGSLRAGSHCSAVLRTLADLLPVSSAVLTVHSLRGIPLYDADLDGNARPPAVEAFKKAIQDCDGLVICSPEYNYGMPGVLKNALDWASRPGFASPMKNKPALVMTASPGTAGGVRAQHQIRETLAAVLACPVAYPHIAIASVHQKITDGRLDDAATLDFVLRAVDALQDEVRLLARDR